MTETQRTWTDPDGDTWYLAEKDGWSLFAPEDGQPPSVPNITVDRMRETFPSFPY
jgi:hypothetical protein